jgi:SAM-dependent methyltransferase
MNKPVLEIIPDNLDGLKILDVGFGYGEWGLMLRTRKKGNPYIVGIDIFKPYYDKQKPLRIYNEIHNINALDYPKGVQETFDIILVSEVIEHIEKKEGYQLLSKLDTLCTSLLIVTTPRGETFHGKAVDENIHNCHISGWELQELQELGFNTQTVDKTPLPKILRLVDKIRRFLFALPRHPQQIIAWKHIDRQL